MTMFVRTAPVPTPIASSTPVKRDEPQTRGSDQPLAPKVKPTKIASDPMVIEMTGGQIELQAGELAKIVEKMNETVRIFNHALEFQVAEDRVIVRVVDTSSGAVVREIPPESFLDAFNRMEQLLGVLLDRRV